MVHTRFRGRASGQCPWEDRRDVVAEKIEAERIKAFVDDLARISLRHGIVLSGRSCPQLPPLVPLDPDWGGYQAMHDGSWYWTVSDVEAGETMQVPPGVEGVRSIKVSDLSAHERLSITSGGS
jgi:hypothetical protein